MGHDRHREEPNDGIGPGTLPGWVSELDTCDAYIVLVGDPTADDPLCALGPHPGRVALEVADYVAALLDVEVRVVRFHWTPATLASDSRSGLTGD